MYLDGWSTIKGTSNVIPFAAVDSKHGNEVLILVFGPRASFDVRVESFSPSLQELSWMNS